MNEIRVPRGDRDRSRAMVTGLTGEVSLRVGDLAGDFSLTAAFTGVVSRPLITLFGVGSRLPLTGVGSL